MEAHYRWIVDRCVFSHSPLIPLTDAGSDALGVHRNYPSISYPSIIWVAVKELKQVTIMRKPCCFLYIRIMETSCKFIKSNPVIAFFHTAAENSLTTVRGLASYLSQATRAISPWAMANGFRIVGLGFRIIV